MLFLNLKKDFKVEADFRDIEGNEGNLAVKLSSKLNLKDPQYRDRVVEEVVRGIYKVKGVVITDITITSIEEMYLN